jgi:hypothetical protein
VTILSTIYLASVATWGILIIFPIGFLVLRWKNKYNLLEGSFNDRSFELYYKLFKPAVVKPDDKEYRDIFHENYKKTYGRRTFIIPLVIFIVVLFICGSAVYLTVSDLIIKNNTVPFLPPIALSALFGAYMWVGYDQIERFRTQDFTIHDVHMWTLRFIISIPIGYSISYIVKEPLGIPVAFFIGAFPMKSLQKYMRRITEKYFKLSDQADFESSELQKIQGIEKKESDRLQDEGVTNILQLAYYDPIDLTMKTTFDFLYVIDIKAQALLWIYFSDHLSNELRLLGLRSAHETYTLKLMLEDSHPTNKKVADDNLKEIADKLEVSPESIKKTVHEVADDPHTIFLFLIWCNEDFDTCLADS